MRHLPLFISLFISIFCFSQDFLEKYPKGQEDYFGGNTKFYEDFHQAIINNDLKTCENPDEYYYLNLLIYPDQTIKFVKDEDPTLAEKNKCAFELAREGAKYLKGWKAATVGNEKVIALTGFYIFPSDLFTDYKPDYDATKSFENATYEGGLNKFRQKIAQNIDLRRFSYNMNFKIVLTFTIDPDGNLINLELAENTGIKEFDEMIIKNVKSIQNKWTPAKIKGRSVSSRFRIPLTFKTSS